MELTKATIAKLPSPATGYDLHRDDRQRGLGVRVSASGSKAWILERMVNGKNYRRTLGDADGPKVLTRTEALSAFALTVADLERGEDRVTLKKAANAPAGAPGGPSLTVAAALTEYVDQKRKAKGNLPLKARTKADYLQMLEAPRLLKNDKMTKGGDLFTIAAKPLAQLTGDDIRAVHAATVGERRRDYVMQVLRALLNWHGVVIADDPLSKTQPGKTRIRISPTKVSKNPIPKAKLAPWRAAMAAANSRVAADAINALLLSGCRPVELLGDTFGNEPLRVKDVDLADQSFKVENTKNRGNHTVFMSRQLLAIVARNCKDKKPGAAVFPVQDVGKTMSAICVGAGMAANAHTPSDTRSTFASIAAALVAEAAVGRMLNHTPSTVTQTNYIEHGPEYLRECWQKVADFIDAA